MEIRNYSEKQINEAIEGLKNLQIDTIIANPVGAFFIVLFSLIWLPIST